MILVSCKLGTIIFDTNCDSEAVAWYCERKGLAFADVKLYDTGWIWRLSLQLDVVVIDGYYEIN